MVNCLLHLGRFNLIQQCVGSVPLWDLIKDTLIELRLLIEYTLEMFRPAIQYPRSVCDECRAIQ